MLLTLTHCAPISRRQNWVCLSPWAAREQVTELHTLQSSRSANTAFRLWLWEGWSDIATWNGSNILGLRQLLCCKIFLILKNRVRQASLLWGLRWNNCCLTQCYSHQRYCAERERILVNGFLGRIFSKSCWCKISLFCCQCQPSKDMQILCHEDGDWSD